MIFPEYERLFEYCAVLSFIAICAWLFRLLRNRHVILRIAGRIVSLAFMGVASFMLLGMVSCEFSNKSSAPIFSPDRKYAVKIYDYDGGATGGETEVILFSNHGLHSQSIFFGEWKTVVPQSIRWINDQEIRMEYVPYYEKANCKDTRQVKIVCVARAQPTP